MGAAIYATIHNLTHYLDTMRAMRHSILLGRFEEFRQDMRSRAAAGADDP